MNPTSTQNKLTVTTPSDLEIVLTRAFDAPRELVFDVFTKPEHIRRWWGCDRAEMTVCEVDLRVGGAWRFVIRMGENECGFHGEYREIKRPERTIQTQIFEPFPDNESVVTLEFQVRDGKTWMVETIVHDCKEARDGHLQSGMEEGAAASLDAAEALLAELQKA